MWLGYCGYDVTAVGSGAEALEKLGAGEFDLIVCDIGLPDMDGAELMRRARVPSRTPALAFSAYDNLPSKYPDFDQLFTGRIPKSATPEAMEAIIQKTIAERPLTSDP